MQIQNNWPLCFFIECILRTTYFFVHHIIIPNPKKETNYSTQTPLPHIPHNSYPNPNNIWSFLQWPHLLLPPSSLLTKDSYMTTISTKTSSISKRTEWWWDQGQTKLLLVGAGSDRSEGLTFGGDRSSSKFRAWGGCCSWGGRWRWFLLCMQRWWGDLKKGSHTLVIFLLETICSCRSTLPRWRPFTTRALLLITPFNSTNPMPSQATTLPNPSGHTSKSTCYIIFVFFKLKLGRRLGLVR